mmetsp:Transcript_15689/g.40110  ORF Transcript_15689/g.40110 Transcript_15689/m.40110 type:complete len:632 (-) Transcript_15689:88-1983(-)
MSESSPPATNQQGNVEGVGLGGGGGGGGGGDGEKRQGVRAEDIADALEKELELNLSTITEEEVAARYDLRDIIGDGASGVVQWGVRRGTEEEIAVKIISRALLRLNMDLLQEIALLRSLRHENIVRLYEAVYTPNNLYIVMELVDGMPLFDAILENKNYSEDVARRILRKLLSGLRYLHRNGVAHRDIKPENIQVHFPPENLNGNDTTAAAAAAAAAGVPSTLQVKLLDFGLSKRVADGLLTPVGTLGYKAPELVREERHNQAVDMWATGVITYVMLCGFPPFFSDEEARHDKDFLMNAPFWFFFNNDSDVLRQQILRGEPTFPSPFWDSISKEAQNFISQLLVVDPTKRLSAEEASRHPWISGPTDMKRLMRQKQQLSVTSTLRRTLSYRRRRGRVQSIEFRFKPARLAALAVPSSPGRNRSMTWGQQDDMRDQREEVLNKITAASVAPGATRQVQSGSSQLLTGAAPSPKDSLRAAAAAAAAAGRAFQIQSQLDADEQQTKTTPASSTAVSTGTSAESGAPAAAAAGWMSASAKRDSNQRTAGSLLSAASSSITSALSTTTSASAASSVSASSASASASVLASATAFASASSSSARKPTVPGAGVKTGGGDGEADCAVAFCSAPICSSP